MKHLSHQLASGLTVGDMKQPIQFLLMLFAFVSLDAVAQVTVVVAPEYRAIHYKALLELKPGQVAAVDLHLNQAGDSYVVYAKTRSPGLSLMVIDGRERAANNLNPLPLLNQQISGEATIKIPKPLSSEGLIAVLLNRSRSTIEVAARIDRVGIRAAEVRRQVRDSVAIPFESLDRVYKLPSITVTVRPCGQINAFSAPDIVVCSELLADLHEKNVFNALYPILLHELAHSLLNIWNLPGFDNEDVADEFAAVFLARYSPDILSDYVRWLEGNDSRCRGSSATRNWRQAHDIGATRSQYAKNYAKPRSCDEEMEHATCTIYSTVRYTT